MRIFGRWYFGLCWNLKLVIIELWSLEGFWLLLEDFFEDYIFAWWKYLGFHNSFFWNFAAIFSPISIDDFSNLQNCQKFSNFNLHKGFVLFFKCQMRMPNVPHTHTHTHTQVIIEFPWGQPLDVFWGLSRVSWSWFHTIVQNMAFSIYS